VASLAVAVHAAGSAVPTFQTLTRSAVGAVPTASTRTCSASPAATFSVVPTLVSVVVVCKSCTVTPPDGATITRAR
jgi:hypothetical protein